MDFFNDQLRNLNSISSVSNLRGRLSPPKQNINLFFLESQREKCIFPEFQEESSHFEEIIAFVVCDQHS